MRRRGRLRRLNRTAGTARSSVRRSCRTILTCLRRLNDSHRLDICRRKIHLFTDEGFETIVGPNDASTDEVANGEGQRTPILLLANSTSSELRNAATIEVVANQLRDGVEVEGLTHDICDEPGSLQEECLIFLVRSALGTEVRQDVLPDGVVVHVDRLQGIDRLTLKLGERELPERRKHDVSTLIGAKIATQLVGS